jgi:DNA-binding response OmpR family regulator
MKKILIVDDAKHLADALSEVLMMEGFEVKVVYDGQQALALIDNFEPELLITDLRMPKIDGLDLIQAVRNHVRLNNIPIVIISASASEGTREHALKLGANLFVTKPFDDALLVKALFTILEK